MSTFCVLCTDHSAGIGQTLTVIAYFVLLDACVQLVRATTIGLYSQLSADVISNADKPPSPSRWR